MTKERPLKGEITVEWGDCDEAGIVFYPNYFYWFDCGFQKLLRSRGLSQRELKRRFGCVTPLVEANAKFLAPVSYDDILHIRARVGEWADRRFRVDYAMEPNGKKAVEGYEVRAWAEMRDGRLTGLPVNAEFKTLMS
jgi:YbgC/YbaW family acyl-CoA thioester hydrolase